MSKGSRRILRWMREQRCSLRTGSNRSGTTGAEENEGKRRFRHSVLFVRCLSVNGTRAVLTLHSASPRPAPFSTCRPAFFPAVPFSRPFFFFFCIFSRIVRPRWKVAGRPPAAGKPHRQNRAPAPAFSPGTATNTFPAPRILLEITCQPCRTPVSVVLRQEGGRLKCRAARHGMALSAVPKRM